jgi:hypothetical protein
MKLNPIQLTRRSAPEIVTETVAAVYFPVCQASAPTYQSRYSGYRGSLANKAVWKVVSDYTFDFRLWKNEIQIMYGEEICED